jgi:hypothetical protein
MEHLLDTAHRRFRLCGILPLWTASLTLLVFAWQDVSHTDSFDHFVSSIYLQLFALSCLLGLAIEVILRRLFRCGRCKAYLGRPRMDGPVERQEYIYDCSRCQITWHTGTFQSTD